MNDSQHGPRSARTCQVMREGQTYRGAQGLTYFAGVSFETTKSEKLCMHLVRIPPGARANAHQHHNHETAIYLLSGEVEMWYGERLEQHLVARAGDFVYIPANMPHLPYNTGSVEALGVLARTDRNEQESVERGQQLDALK